MNALDTNAIIRFLVDDDERQAAIVQRVFNQAEQANQPMLVTGPVLLESIWVLESVYGVERAMILETINELLMLPVLEFEKQPAIRRFVESASQSRIDLSDALIGHWAEELGCEAVLTFDKKAARSNLFERLQ